MVKCSHLGRRRIASPLSGEHPPSAAQGTPQPPQAHEAQHGVCKKTVQNRGRELAALKYIFFNFFCYPFAKHYLLAQYH